MVLSYVSVKRSLLNLWCRIGIGLSHLQSLCYFVYWVYANPWLSPGQVFSSYPDREFIGVQWMNEWSVVGKGNKKNGIVNFPCTEHHIQTEERKDFISCLVQLTYSNLFPIDYSRLWISSSHSASMKVHRLHIFYEIQQIIEESSISSWYAMRQHLEQIITVAFKNAKIMKHGSSYSTFVTKTYLLHRNF